jgi:clan AA aspartic protease (TIGR02281 family)
MKAVLNRTSGFAAAAVLMVLTGTLMAGAQDRPPDQILKDQGLKRAPSATWVLVAEAAVLKDVRKAQNLSMRLRFGQEQQQALEMGNQNPQVLIQGLRQQVDWLEQRIDAYDQELANLGPSGGNPQATVYHNMLVTERNSIVTEQNSVRRMISSLADQRGQFQDLKKRFNAEVAEVRESYMLAVGDLRKAVDEIMAKYAEIGGKEEVSRALKDLSASSKIKQKLGPSKELTSAIKWLGRLEGSVQSETVVLQRENGVDHLDVMLNGKGPIKMVFDTGAGPMTLPAEVATRLNLKSTGRTVECEVADGTKVAAKEMIIRTVTVGRLTVKDVICVVMPKDKGDVAPLLGQSFLQRFDYKYTQGSGKLVLNKVEPDEPAGPSGKSKSTRKKR